MHDKNKMIRTYRTGVEGSAERTGIENRGIIRPTPNWLLITIDREIDRAQVQGITIDTSWEKEKHAIVTGEVVALSNLKYTQPEYGKSDTLINGESPLEFDTDMEVQLGDNVYFNYLSMNKAIITGRVIEYKEKMCAFIRYDRLYAIERNGVFLGANGYILATRQKAVISSLLEIPNHRNKNEAIVDVVGTPLREYFWEKMQSDNPYYDHGFVQPNDKIVFRETSARQLENKVVRVRDIEYARLQEKDIFARIRGGILTPNIGITMVERLANPLSEQLFGTEAFNKTAKGIITASLQFSGEVYYKIGNERTLEIDGQSYTFVIDCYNCTEIKGKQILS